MEICKDGARFGLRAAAEHERWEVIPGASNTREDEHDDGSMPGRMKSSEPVPSLTNECLKYLVEATSTIILRDSNIDTNWSVTRYKTP